MSPRLLLYWFVIAGFVKMVSAFAPCAATAQQRADTIRVQDRTRSYTLYLPKNYGAAGQASQRLPLVIALHGANQDPVDGNGSLRAITEWQQKADAENFVVVFPEGTGLAGTQVGLTWNAGGCCPPANSGSRPPDDVGFVAALITKLVAAYRIDATRVYATGFSNGAMMSYRLGCELSSSIAAIGSVAGALVVEQPCLLRRAVPALHIHALNDAVVPYQGGAGIFGAAVRFPSVDSTVRQWRSLLGCGQAVDTVFRAVQANSLQAVGQRWKPCNGGGGVLLYTTTAGGHTWTGAPGSAASQAFKATDVLWEFFRRYTTAETATNLVVEPSVDDACADVMTVSPNPTREAVSVKHCLAAPEFVQFTLFDLLGRKIGQLWEGKLLPGCNEVTARLPEGLPQGAYILRSTSTKANVVAGTLLVVGN